MGMKMVLGDVGGANADLASYCLFSVGYNFVSSYCISSALGGLLFGSWIGTSRMASVDPRWI